MSTPQVSRAALAHMTAEQIVEAYRTGQLAEVLGAAPAPAVPDTGQLGREHAAVMPPEALVEAYRAGRFAELLGGGPTPPPTPASVPVPVAPGPRYVPPPWLPTGPDPVDPPTAG